MSSRRCDSNSGRMGLNDYSGKVRGSLCPTENKCGFGAYTDRIFETSTHCNNHYDIDIGDDEH